MLKNTFCTEQIWVTSSVISILKDVIKHIAKYDGNETLKLYKNIVRNSQPFISIMKNFSKFKKNNYCLGPGRFPGIAGNAGNHGNDRQFH